MKRSKYIRGTGGVTRIIRADYNGGLYSKGWKELRASVLKRDNHTCQKCFRHLSVLKELGIPLQVNHIRPKSRGGTDHPSNLLTLCYVCHKQEPRHSHMARKTPKFGKTGTKKKKSASPKWRYKRKF